MASPATGTHGSAALPRRGGHLTLLQWACSSERDAPCACDTTAYAAAIRGGHLGVFQWLCAIKQPRVWNWFCNQAAVCSTDDVILWMATRAHFRYPEVCDRTAGVGNLGLLRALHTNGATWSARGIRAAVKGGHLEVLQWMRMQDTDAHWGSDLGSEAASIGHLPVLQWLCAQSPEMHYSLRSAVINGHLHILQWAHAQGRALSFERVVYAGHLAVIQWLAPLLSYAEIHTSHAIVIAACDGNLPVLRWLRECTDCPLGRALQRAVDLGYTHIIKYLS